jgi:Holliday junction resolvase RusA-like endonuclease
MRVFLPYPPSVNDRLVPTKAGRLVLQARYRAWMQNAAWVVALAMRDARAARIDGPYAMAVSAMPPLLSQVRDLDNILKATSDALQKGGAVEDDRFCQRVTIEWGELDEAGVLVEIEPCQNLLSPEAGSASLPRETPKSRIRRRSRRAATIPTVTSGGASATGSLGSRASGSPPSSTSAESTACGTTRTKPKT